MNSDFWETFGRLVGAACVAIATVLFIGPFFGPGGPFSPFHPDPTLLITVLVSVAYAISSLRAHSRHKELKAMLSEMMAEEPGSLVPLDDELRQRLVAAMVTLTFMDVSPTGTVRVYCTVDAQLDTNEWQSFTVMVEFDDWDDLEALGGKGFAPNAVIDPHTRTPCMLVIGAQAIPCQRAYAAPGGGVHPATA